MRRILAVLLLAGLASSGCTIEHCWNGYNLTAPTIDTAELKGITPSSGCQSHF